MANDDLLRMSIAELSPRVRSGEVSPVEITAAALAKAEQLQPTLNSFITLLKDQAMAQAREEESAIARGEYKGPLQGIPIGLKDNLATAGVVTTLGTKVLADNVPEEDAEVVRRCRAAGPSSWARKTWKSLPPAPPPTTLTSGRCITRGGWTTYPAAPAAAAGPTWPPRLHSPRWGLT